MLKKTITYESLFTKEMVTEDHYFHISKADLIEMEMVAHKDTFTKDGETHTGLRAKLMRIGNSDDGQVIIDGVKFFIHKSYGKKDGDRFLKSKEIWDDFSASEAYSELLFDLCTDAVKAAEFISGIIPHNIEQIAAEVAAKMENQPEASELVAKARAEREKGTSTVIAEPKPESKLLTDAEIREMDPGEMRAGVASGKYRLS